MKKIVVLLFGIFLASVIWADGSDDRDLLNFGSMVGVSGPFVGPVTPIQGVGGAGRNWTVSRARGELKSNGEIEVHVRGLVFADGTGAGTNPLKTFRAVLSCQSIDAAGKPTIILSSTGDFPASPEGDAEIEGTVEVASPCFAPIVFVTTSTPIPRWLAVTGH